MPVEQAAVCFTGIPLKAPIDRSVPLVLQIVLAAILPLPGSIRHLQQGEGKPPELQPSQPHTSIASHPLAGGMAIA